MRFTKGHGTGNDFVVLPDPDGDLALDPGLIAALCDRRQGIGADGVLRVVLTAAVPEVADLAEQARWFMDYRNADGSIAEMCGNGIRVYARYLVAQGYAAAGPLTVATRAGVRQLEVAAEGDISVDMGEPRVLGAGRTVAYHDQSWDGTEVWVGNPHVVVWHDDLASLGRELEPPTVEPALSTNVEFVAVHGPGKIALRVHERGVGETQSCGTGACAAAVAEATWRGAGSADATVEVPGGRLGVRWDGRAVTLVGPAELVAHGVVEDSWLRTR